MLRATLGVLAALAVILCPAVQAQEVLIKDGFYKVESVLDRSALTATRKGHPPHFVITDDWNGYLRQEWKVKTKLYGGTGLHFLRNAGVSSNEVTKKFGGEEQEHYITLVLVDWTFIKAGNGEENVVAMSSESGCLKNNGKGTRISFDVCDVTDPSQQWHFDYLFDELPNRR